VRTADRLVTAAVRRCGHWLTVLVVATLGGAILQLVLPYTLGRAVDALISGAAATDGRFLAVAAVVAGVVLCESLGIWAAGASSAQATAWLRRSALRHVLGVGQPLARRIPEGDLVTRLGMNAEEVGRAPEAVVTAAALLLPTVGSLVALALIDLWLPLTLLIGLVLISLVLHAFLRSSTTIAGGYQEAQAAVAARLADALTGIRTIAAAETTGTETRRVLSPLPRLREHGLGLWRANARAGVQAGLVVPLLEIAVLGVGGLLLASGDLTVGELYAAARYVVLGAGLSGALGYLGRLARARSAAGRVAEILAEPATAHGTKALPPGPGTLEFRDVGLRMFDSTGLHGIDLVIPGGSVTAVVGRSGTGKSLLTLLAGRLTDPDQGTVLLDGVPLPEIAHGELRRAIGYAFERPALIGDTLAEAISLGRPERTPEPAAVHNAARAARADAFILRLPGGYSTCLADAPMSGGERQRVGLARAFAHGERVLILDDATSSLDTVTEHQVSKALTGELGGRTRLVVAGRVATAARADRVIWLADGRVRGYDRHDVLWENPGYRAVFQAAP
jgi:ATP-binding cassette, subfamily B, bacterial RamA/AmfB